MSKIVKAREAFSTEAPGYPRPVAKGETFDSSHPIVKAHPGAFEEWGVDNPGVETTSADPGEKRRTTRRKRRKPKVKAKASAQPARQAASTKGKSLTKSDKPGSK